MFMDTNAYAFGQRDSQDIPSGAGRATGRGHLSCLRYRARELLGVLAVASEKRIVL